MMIDHHMNIHRSLILKWKYIVDVIGDEVLQLMVSNRIFQSIPIEFEFESQPQVVGRFSLHAHHRMDEVLLRK